MSVQYSPNEISETGLKDLQRSAHTYDKNNDTSVRVIVSEFLDVIENTFTPSGLKNGGLDTIMTLVDSSWTPLPLSALVPRNSLQIQNQSEVEILTTVNVNPQPSQTYGVKVPAGGSAFIDITDEIIIYGRSTSGSASIVVREVG